MLVSSTVSSVHTQFIRNTVVQTWKIFASYGLIVNYKCNYKHNLHVLECSCQFLLSTAQLRSFRIFVATPQDTKIVSENVVLPSVAKKGLSGLHKHRSINININLSSLNFYRNVSHTSYLQ